MHCELELSIKRREWLVQQRCFSAVDNHARETDTLAHSAGQFAWKTRLKSVEPNRFYDDFRAGFAFGPGRPASSNGKAMLSRTFRQGSRLSFWVMYPTSVLRSLTRSPL